MQELNKFNNSTFGIFCNFICIAYPELKHPVLR